MPEDGDAFKVLLADFVTTEDGTGIVHIAPSFGADDSLVAKKNNIGSLTLVDEKGNVLDGDDLLYILAFSNPNRVGPWSGVVGTLMSNLGLEEGIKKLGYKFIRACLLYTSPSPRDRQKSRMPSSA